MKLKIGRRRLLKGNELSVQLLNTKDNKYDRNVVKCCIPYLFVYPRFLDRSVLKKLTGVSLCLVLSNWYLSLKKPFGKFYECNAHQNSIQASETVPCVLSMSRFLFVLNFKNKFSCENTEEEKEWLWGFDREGLRRATLKR